VGWKEEGLSIVGRFESYYAIRGKRRFCGVCAIIERKCCPWNKNKPNKTKTVPNEEIPI
jgi:hypothetical protein